MLQAFAVDNHVPWQTPAMPLFEKEKVGHASHTASGLTPSTGVLYLYMKTIERAHSPAHMWERIRLADNYSKALEQVLLIFFPLNMCHRL